MPRTITLPSPLAQRLNSCGGIPSCERGPGQRVIDQFMEPAQGGVIDNGLDEDVPKQYSL
jgi:hypothetical protein